MSNQTVYIKASEMFARFESILNREGFAATKAKMLADVFTQNSVDGVTSHGVNRFKRFVEYTRNGIVDKNAEPVLAGKFNGMEQWNGQLGPGILNAQFAAEQSMKLAAEYGIGCVALSNTNHWMRGGTYGWQAAKKGFVLISWTNTTGLMPAWGAVDARLGNNPLVIAVPFLHEAIVLDMAVSQFSNGALELKAMNDEWLSVDGGYDEHGELTKDPSAILASKRPVPVGYWKGAGLSLLLDLLAAILSGGLSAHEITKRETEHSLSQVFIAIDLSKLSNHSSIPQLIERVIADYKESVPENAAAKITYPGERILQARERNLENGIPVSENTWNEIVNL